MVPGDVLTLKLSALNKSNVKTKTRFMVSHATVGTKGDLFPALEFTFKAGSLNATDLFRWQENDAVADSALEQGVALYGEDGLELTIAFPDGDNGEILFGEANHDNQYQDCACSIAFGLEAVQGNAATSPIDEINAYLSAEMLFEGQNKTMYEAVQDMAELEYDLSILNYNNVNYVYSLDNDQFVAETSVTENHYRYFKVCSEMPGTQTFSIYAANDFSANEGAVALTGVGFDAGDSTGVMSVSYAGIGQDDARSNVIRTNSLATAVTINAPYDTVKHYGDAASVNIQAVAGNSYHEFGNVAFTEIASGRIVLEEGSKTEQIHLNAKDDNSFDTITIANNGLATEELPSKITRDQIDVQNEKELVVTVHDLREATVEPVYAYPYEYVEQEQTIPAGTTEKTTVHNVDVETPLGMKVIDSNAHDGEKALAPAAKNEAKETAIEEVIEDNDYVAQISTKFYKTFNEAFDEVSNNDTLKVLNDCNAWSRYNLSGKNLTLEVKKNATLSCGTVINGKFIIGENNAAGIFTLAGEGTIEFNGNSNWGLVNQMGSGNSIKTVAKDLTIRALGTSSFVSDGNMVFESGTFENIYFNSTPMALNGGSFTFDFTDYLPDGKMAALVDETHYAITDLDQAHSKFVVTKPNDDAAYYRTLRGAVEAAETGDVVTALLPNQTYVIDSQDKNVGVEQTGIIIDLNGGILEVSDAHYAFYFSSIVDLTLKNAVINAKHFCTYSQTQGCHLNAQNVLFRDDCEYVQDCVIETLSYFKDTDTNYFSFVSEEPANYLVKLERAGKGYYYTGVSAEEYVFGNIFDNDRFYLHESISSSIVVPLGLTISVCWGPNASEPAVVEGEGADELVVTVVSGNEKTYFAKSLVIAKIYDDEDNLVATYKDLTQAFLSLESDNMGTKTDYTLKLQQDVTLTSTIALTQRSTDTSKLPYIKAYFDFNGYKVTSSVTMFNLKMVANNYVNFIDSSSGKTGGAICTGNVPIILNNYQKNSNGIIRLNGGTFENTGGGCIIRTGLNYTTGSGWYNYACKIEVRTTCISDGAFVNFVYNNGSYTARYIVLYAGAEVNATGLTVSTYSGGTYSTGISYQGTRENLDGGYIRIS